MTKAVRLRRRAALCIGAGILFLSLPSGIELAGAGRRVTLGGLVFDRPRLGLSRAQSGSSSRTERDGIIGNALLETFVVTVDYTRRTLVLERP